MINIEARKLIFLVFWSRVLLVFVIKRFYLLAKLYCFEKYFKGISSKKTLLLLTFSLKFITLIIYCRNIFADAESYLFFIEILCRL